MAFEVFKDSQQGAAFVICVVTTPVCILATYLRFVATKRAHRKIGIEDWFSLVALIFFVPYTLIFIYLLTRLNGKSLQELAKLPPEEGMHILKVGWAMSPQFCGNQLFSKLSLFALYYRIFSVNETFLRWIYSLVGLQIAWFISAYVVKWNLCSPAPFAWDKTIEGGTCIDIGAFLAASETINSLVDFAMIGLAVWIVQSLQVDTSTKWRLCILFSLGGLSGVIGFIKIGEAYSAAYTNILDPIWDIVQMATSIICCCAPIYRSLVIELGSVRRLSSKLSSQLGLTWLRTRSSQTRKSSWTDSNTNKSKSRTRDENWMPIDGSSQRELAWEVSAAPYNHAAHAEDGRSHHSDNPVYPMKTLEVRQNIEFV
ncbi:uncharacterized protein F4822DRAFT_389641 [Hypoxylon trugodes]|uniref:uncharacterized protein n=1 Tax=Hypoxylon trugodes TaxID=326681 RepID=UPI00219C2E36|nr:uncharacterized protein F4822DRAFT_389641 [Hypoxylon trugodes]KAI1392108.1 hypothetical protein F4822DRAFT_389641 [Hypoxylon trugodes]